MTDPYPEDMGQALKARLRYDLSVFGTSFYRETNDGYERLNPAEVVCDSDGPPDGVELDRAEDPGDHYGTPAVEDGLSAAEVAENSEFESSGHRTLWI